MLTQIPCSFLLLLLDVASEVKVDRDGEAREDDWMFADLQRHNKHQYEQEASNDQHPLRPQYIRFLDLLKVVIQPVDALAEIDPQSIEESICGRREGYTGVEDTIHTLESRG